ncbi:MAG: hypothetical protein WAW39_02285 [Prosthecobacter sp.]|uniref:hypothetical protein n=1 Tax=Prosthecobacter sp. TaxID=1965333 RepID=UPI003BAEC749
MSPSTASRTQNGKLKLAGAYIPEGKYEALVKLAKASNRSLAGQCRHIYDQALLEALIERACTPRVGDRFGAGEVRVEVLAVRATDDVEPGRYWIIEYTDSRVSNSRHELFHGEYEEMVTKAIKNHGPSIFHPAEDNEE